MNLLLILLALLSCSQTKSIQEFESVSLSPTPQSESSDIIKINSVVDGSENQVLIGPLKGEKKEPTIALSLYSTIYHSLAVLDLLKSLEQNQINISIISSHGFGSIIAALYAKKRSISNVEWSLFKLLKDLKSEKVYTQSWNSKVDKFIDSEFGALKFEELEIKLVIPHLVDGDKIDLILEGEIASVLKNGLLLSRPDNFLQKPDLYHFAIERLGVDLNLAVSFLPDAPSFEHLNGYSYGLITRLLGIIMNAKQDLTTIKSSRNLVLDKIYPLADINDSYHMGITDFIKEVNQIYLKWKEDSSSGFQFQ